MFNVAGYIIWGDNSSTIEPELAERALRYYKANIEAGDTDSMLDLGAMYRVGRGVTKDAEQAIELYQKAAEKLAPKAFRCLGNYWKYDLMDDGAPIPTADEERLEKAYKYFAKGAELWEENCLYELGDFFRYGCCVEKDEKKAFKLYDLAYEAITDYTEPNEWAWNDSYSDVCLRLAECYHYGLGTEVNLKKAREFIEIAKIECKRRLDEGDMYGGAYYPRAEREWLKIMQESVF
jgi:hypothetical protein